MSVRVRFAPSPTGFHHLGNFRTAVFAYLVARQAEGSFFVRIEDTDKSREVEGSAEYLLKVLDWLGLDTDEGPYLDAEGQIKERGEYGPYLQSSRLDIYKKHSDYLLEKGAAYRCFCTPERLEQVRTAQQAKKEAPRYDRHCRNLSKEESEARALAGEKYVIRQAMPDNQTVVLHDLIRGEITFNSSDLDDHVLIKSDGFPTYQMANVVDDHLMEISHVLRGEEWIPSAPKNLLLYAAFDWQPPHFAHLPLILGPDKAKLSKRHGAEPMLTYQEKGYLPEAMLNVLSFLGWSPGTEEEFFSKEELVKRFRLEKVQKAPAVFEAERLDYVNGWYIRHLPLGEVAERMLPYLQAADLVKKAGDVFQTTQEIDYPNASFGEYLLAVAAVVQERLKHFDESAEVTRFFFSRPVINPELQKLIVPKKAEPLQTAQLLKEASSILAGIALEDWTLENLEIVLRQFIQQKEVKVADVLWPIRAALTGASASPGAFEMLYVLGKDESLFRLQSLKAVLV